jgi:hypothetical protein
METQARARMTARQLVTLTRVGDADTVSLMVRLLSDPTSNGREPLRLVLTELLRASAVMVVRQIGGLEPGCAIVLDLRQVDGSTVDIDGLQPEVRAIVRALLAEVHGHPQDAEDQISLALSGSSAGLADGVALVLMWTVSAMAWCEAHDEPAPGWLVRTSV